MMMAKYKFQTQEGMVPFNWLDANAWMSEWSELILPFVDQIVTNFTATISNPIRTIIMKRPIGSATARFSVLSLNDALLKILSHLNGPQHG